MVSTVLVNTVDNLSKKGVYCRSSHCLVRLKIAKDVPRLLGFAM